MRWEKINIRYNRKSKLSHLLLASCILFLIPTSLVVSNHCVWGIFVPLIFLLFPLSANKTLLGGGGGKSQPVSPFGCVFVFSYQGTCSPPLLIIIVQLCGANGPPWTANHFKCSFNEIMQRNAPSRESASLVWSACTFLCLLASSSLLWQVCKVCLHAALCASVCPSARVFVRWAQVQSRWFIIYGSEVLWL